MLCFSTFLAFGEILKIQWSYAEIFGSGVGCSEYLFKWNKYTGKFFCCQIHKIIKILVFLSWTQFQNGICMNSRFRLCDIDLISLFLLWFSQTLKLNLGLLVSYNTIPCPLNIATALSFVTARFYIGTVTFRDSISQLLFVKAAESHVACHCPRVWHHDICKSCNCLHVLGQYRGQCETLNFWQAVTACEDN